MISRLNKRLKDQTSQRPNVSKTKLFGGLKVWRFDRFRGRSQRGFTLIELTMVFVISMLLMLILLRGYQQTQRRERFRTAVESIVAELEQLKGETAATVNSTGGGNKQGTVVWGKSLTFSNDSGVASIATTTAADSDILDPASLRAEDSHALTIPWGATYQQTGSSAFGVLYIKELSSAAFNTFVYSTLIYYGTGEPVDPDNGTGRLIFTDPTGLRATVSINASNGTITRTYDN